MRLIALAVLFLFSSNYSSSAQCNAPTSASSQVINSTLVNLSWTPSPTFSSFQIQYGTLGFTLGTGITLSTPASNFSLSGLTPSTNYQYYVRQFCTNGDTSSWFGPVSFNTFVISCASTISAFPYLTNFDDNTYNQWVNTAPSRVWSLNLGSTSSGSTGPTSDFSGTGRYVYTEATGASNSTFILESPCLDFTSRPSPYITYKYHMFGGSMGSLSLQVSQNGTSWTTLRTFSGNQGTAWLSDSVSLSAYTNSIIKLRFVGVTGPSFTSDMALDEILIDNIPAFDLSLNALTNPVNPINAGNQAVTVNISNNGANQIDSVRFDWSVNGTAKTPFVYSQVLNPATNQNVTIGNHNFVGNDSLIITASILGQIDQDTTNNELSVNLCSGISGTRTVGLASSDYLTMQAALADLQSCGLSGTLTLSLEANITEQVELNATNIIGLSNTRKLRIEGNGFQWRFNHVSSLNQYILLLNGMKHLELDSITFKPLSSNFGVGVIFNNASDSNQITNCTFDLSNIVNAQTTTMCGIAFTNNYSNPANGFALTGSYNLIRNCNFINGRFGVVENGANFTLVNEGNRFIDNEFVDFGVSGYQGYYTNNLELSNNKFHRPNVPNTPSYVNGIRLIYVRNALVNANEITNLGNGFSITAYGMELSNCLLVTDTLKVTNNLIHGLNNGTQAAMGIYNVNGSGFTLLYHNTVRISPTINSSNCYGLYNLKANTSIKNNIVLFDNVGFNTSYLYFAGNSTFNVEFDYNVGFGPVSNQLYFARYSADYPTLNALQTAGFGLNNLFVNPALNPITLVPNNNALNSAGDAVGVLTDFNGNIRSSPPDIGALEFNPPPIDIGISAILLNAQACNYGNAVQIPFVIENYGADTVTTVGVGYTVNGGLQRSFTTAVVIAPGQSDTILANLSEDFSNAGNYTIRAWTNAAADITVFNDSITTVIRNLPTQVIDTAVGFLENFESFSFGNGPIFSNGWRAENTPSQYWIVDNFTTSTSLTGPSVDRTTGSSGKYIYFDNLNNLPYAVDLQSPCFQLTVGANQIPELSFWYHKYGADMGDLVISVKDEFGNSTALDSILGQTQFSSNEAWLERKITLPRSITNEFQLIFTAKKEVISSSVRSDAAIDDISINLINTTCNPLDSVNIQQLSTSSVQVSVTNNPGSSKLIYEYGLKGFTPGTGTLDSTVSNSFTISSLSQGTAYDLYVYNRCLNGNLTGLSRAFTIFTNAYCTTSLHGTNACNNGTYGISSVQMGSDFTYNLGGCPPLGFAYNMNALELTPGDFYNFTIQCKATSTPGLGVWADFNADNDFDDAGEFIYTSNSTANQHNFSFQIPLNAANKNFVLRIRASNVTSWSSNQSCLFRSFGETVDLLITTGNPPLCPSPINLSASYNGLNSALLSWSPRSSFSSGYLVEYGLQGFQTGQGIKVFTTDTNLSINGLNAFTDYSFQVSQLCSPVDTSSLALRANFSTYPYCLSSLHSTGCGGTIRYDITGVILDSLNSSSSTCLPGSYASNLANQTTLTPGSTYELKLRTSSTINTNMAAWIDFNGNNVFDANEFLGSGSGVVGDTIRILFSVPPTSNVKSTILRIRSSSSPVSSLQACTLLGFGETEDYGIRIGTPPSCYPPFNIQITPGASTASITWSTIGSNVVFYEYGLKGFSRGSGIAGVSNTGSLNIGNLSLMEDYDLYLQQNCGNDSSIAIVSFSTNPYCVSNLHPANTCLSTTAIINSFTANGVTNTSNGCGINGYNLFNNQIINVNAGDTLFFSTTTSGFANCVMWIDYDQNGDLSQTERLSLWTSNNTFSGFGIIPNNAKQGLTLMRVRSRNVTITSTTACLNYTNGETEDYWVFIGPPANCNIPGNPTVSAITDTSATVSWFSNNSFIKRYLILENLDDTSTTRFDVTFEPLPYVINGLTPSTSYQIKNVEYCSPTDSVFASNSATFTTTCPNSCQYTLRLNDSFGDGWNGASLTVNIDGISQNYGMFSGSTISYTLSICNGSSISISFNGGSWNSEVSFLLIDNQGNTLYSRGPNPPIGVTLYSNANLSCSQCEAINDIEISALNANQAVLSWNRFNAGDSVTIQYGLRGFNPNNAGITINTTAEQITLNGLNYFSAYDIYIKNFCQTEDTSVIAGPIPFIHSPYHCSDAQANSCSHSFTVDTVKVGNTVLVTNCDTALYSTGSVNNGVLSFKLGESVPIRINANSFTNRFYYVYFDLNRDGDFVDFGETLLSAVSNTTAQITLNIPSFADTGLTVLRVVAANSSSLSASGCPQSGAGILTDVEDYLVRLVNDCQTPTNLLSTNQTDTSISVVWSGLINSNYQVLITDTNSAPDANLAAITSANTYTFNGLTSGDYYKVYVRLICDQNTFTPWQSIVVATTCNLPLPQMQYADTVYCADEQISGVLALNKPSQTDLVFYSRQNGFIANNSLPLGFSLSSSDTLYTFYQKQNCFSDTAHQPIIINPNPSVFIGNDTLINYGSDYQFTVQASSINPFGFSWSNADSLVNNTLSAQTVNLFTQNSFALTVFDSVTNCSASDSITLKIVGGPLQIALTADADSICFGQNIMLNANVNGGTGNYTYSWNNSGLSNSNIFSISPSVSQWIDVVVSDGNLSSSDSIFVHVEALPTIAINSGNADTSICLGDVIQLTANTAPANSILWSNSYQSVQITLSPADTIAISATSTSPFGCASSATLNINTVPLIEVNIKDTTVCAADSFSIQSPLATNYLWSNGAQSQSITLATDSNTSIWLKAENQLGCPTLDTMSVFVQAVQISLSSDTIVCFDRAITLQASGADQYFWNGANLGASISLTATADTAFVVEGENNLGCKDTDTVTIIVASLPQFSLNQDTTICSGEQILRSALSSQNLTYQWSNSNAGSSVIVNPSIPTLYVVTATDSLGCTQTASTNVNIHPAINIVQTGTLTACEGETISTGFSPSTYQYVWNNGSTASSFNLRLNSDTSFTATVTDQFGCSLLDSVQIGVLLRPSLILNYDSTLCAGDSLWVQASGAFVYSFNGQNQGTNASIADLAIANTNVQVIGTAQNGCTDTANANIIVNSNPQLSFSTSNLVSCVGDTILLDPLNSNNIIAYQWNSGSLDSAITIIANTNSFNTVTATDVNNCSSTASVGVNVVSVSSTVGPTQLVCKGNSYNLSATGGVSYLWENGAQSASTALIADSSRFVKVQITNGLGCTKTDSVFISVRSLPNVELTVDTACFGSNVLASATGAVQYTWSNGQTGANASYQASNDTVIWVRGRDQFQCSSTDSVILTAHPLPVLVASDTAICLNTNITLQAGSFVSYQWSSGDTTASIQKLITANTNYILTVTDSNGCASADTFNVTAFTLPAVNISNDTAICEGESTTLSIIGNYSALWSNGQNSNAITVSPTASTTYQVQVTDSNGCKNSDSVTVAIKALPVINILGNNTICYGGSTQLTANGGSQYSWSTGQNQSSITVNPLQNTQYVVTVTNQDGCISSDSILVLVSAPTGVNISAPTSACLGSTVTINASNSATYTWSNGLTGASIQQIINAPLSLSVIGVDSLGCISNASVNIGVLANPILSTTSDTAICMGSNISLTATGADSYLWNNGTVSNSIQISPTFSSQYSVIGTLLNGCSSTRTINVTVLPNPNVLLSGNSQVCLGDTIQLTASGASTYQWSTGQSGATLSATPASSTSYSVTGTDNFGCVNTQQILINVLPLPTVSFSIPSNICDNSGILPLNTGFPIGGIYSGTGVSAAAFNPLTAGLGTHLITYSVINSNGCSNKTTQSITVNSSPVINSVTSTNVLGCGQSNGSITITASSVLGNLTYSINNGQNFSSNNIFNNLPIGVYPIVVKDGQCETSGSAITISAPGAPAAPSISGKTVYCQGETFQPLLALPSGNGTIYWFADQNLTQLIDSGFNFTPSSAGVYFAAQAGTCIGAAAAVSVVVNQRPQKPNIAGSFQYCEYETPPIITANPSLAGQLLWYTNPNSNPIDSGIQFTTNWPVGLNKLYLREQSNGCLSALDTIEINVIARPASPSVFGSANRCVNDYYDTLSSTGSNIRWYANAQLTNLVSTNNFIVPVSANSGSDTLFVTQTANGCSSLPTVFSFNVFDLPLIDTVIRTNPTACGLNNGIISITASGGSGTYAYSINGGNTFAGTSIFTSLKNGGYPVVVQDAYCRSNITLISLTVPGSPNAPTVSASATYCQGDNIQPIYAQGSNLKWYADAGLNTLISSIDSLIPDSTVGVTQYFATQTIGNCESPAATVSITINTLPTYSIIADTVICQGETTAINLQTNATVTWLSPTGQIGQNIVVSPQSSQYYAFNLVNQAQCSRTDSVHIQVNALPTVSLAPIGNICENSGQFFLTGGTPAGGSYSGPFVSQGAFNSDNSGAGSFSIKYQFTDANQCMAADSAIITINPLPAVSMSTFAGICEQDTSIVLTQGLPIGGNYSGMNVTNNVWNIAGLNPGIYTIDYTYTDPNGCTNSSAANYQIFNLPNVNLNPIGSFCEGDSPITLSGGIPLGGIYFINGLQSTVFSPSDSGRYILSYIYQDGNGCMSFDTTAIIVNPKPKLELVSDTTVNNDSLVLGLPTSFNYAWSNGSSDNPFIITTSGTYSVTASNSFGCSATDTITVDLRPLGITSKDKYTLNVYPNPFTESITLELDNELNGEIWFELMDLSGRIIYRSIINERSTVIQLEGLNAGTYLARLIHPIQSNATTIQLIKL